MLSWIRCAPILLACLALSACGSRHAPTDGVVVQSKNHRATATTAAETTPQRSTSAQILPKPEALADGESVSDASFSISPIARAVAGTEPALAPAIPSKWVLNKNYSTLVPAQPTSVSPDKVEVVEVFWYGCPHCFHLDPYLEGWRTKSKPAFVEFNRMPVMWPGNPVNRSHARLFFTLEALGKLNLHDAVFREIHVNGNSLVDPSDPGRTEQMQKAFLVAHGVTAADFDKTYRSFSVEAKLQRAEQFTQRYQIVAVPTMVVAGKYLADVSTAGGEAELMSLLNDLAAAEHHR